MPQETVSNTFIKDFPANDALCRYKNALSNELCDSLVELFNTNSEMSFAGLTLSGLNQIKKSVEIYLTSEDSNRTDAVKTNLDTEVWASLSLVMRDYQKKFDWLSDCPGIVDTGYKIQKYIANEGRYGEHIDGDPWSTIVTGRLCGVVCYLNDVEVGGETYFRYQDIRVKPEKGTVIVFPANWTHPHEALMPISNDKYIISTFLVAENLRHRNNYYIRNESLF